MKGKKPANCNAEAPETTGGPVRRSDRTNWFSIANRSLSSEAEFHSFLEESPDAVIIADQAGCITFASSRIKAMFGHAPDELAGKPLSILVPERYRVLHAGHLDRFLLDPKPRMMGTGLELRARRKDGSEFPVEISLSPHRTPGGFVVAAAIRDIEATKRFQNLLLQEMHHRVKNMLATVIAITSQSLQSARNLEEGRLAVEGRLVALGRAHDLLLASNRSGAKLSDVIHDATEPFDNHDAGRFIIQGNQMEIASEAILPLSMSLNELCTNAVKYGALSNATGRIDINTIVDDKTQRLKLTWIERGGPAVLEPSRRSFGSRLLDRLADQLHADVRLIYEPKGFVYELDVPLADLQARRAD